MLSNQLKKRNTIVCTLWNGKLVIRIECSYTPQGSTYRNCKSQTLWMKMMWTDERPKRVDFPRMRVFSSRPMPIITENAFSFISQLFAWNNTICHSQHTHTCIPTQKSFHHYYFYWHCVGIVSSFVSIWYDRYNNAIWALYEMLYTLFMRSSACDCVYLR